VTEMPVLDWIGKDKVVNHHNEVPYQVLEYYIKVNNIDLSLEPNNGRGPVDIKSSRGNDKTLLEVKLSSNGQYLHGYQEQVQEYGKAERTRNLIYVLVDVGNPERVKRISELHNKNKDESNPCPELIIINAVPKNAASTYDSKNDDYSFEAVLTVTTTEI